ncbi:MAG: efflux RND transporter periplasmic adaptor subunit, partial [Gemmatimonadaceae bacterium]
LALFVCAGALAGCGGDKTAQGAGGPPGAGGGRGGAMPPMPVEVVVARRDTVVDAINATGQIEAVQAIELRPEVEGRLVAILVAEGSVVGRGTPLFKVDDAELRTQIARLEADRDLAGQALARTKGLLDQRASTTSELERAEATARSTQAQLDLLTLRRDRTTVRAPFAGVVGRRLASLGDYVSSQTRLITLQTFDPQRAVFQVPERFAERLSVGQRVGFRVAALPGREFSGVVDFVDPVVQLPGRTITAKARVANPRRELQSGMFIEARLVTATRPSAVVVPEDAILSLQGATVVWVAKDGKAVRRPVELGVRTPGFVEVTAGIEVGDQVVVGGAERLGEGAPVQPTVVQRGKALVREGPARP